MSHERKIMELTDSEIISLIQSGKLKILNLNQNKIKEISRGLYFDKDLADINGSGYVVESLEAALWCFEKSNNFESAILSAVNLGNDADTTAAVCGQLAGAYYGFNKIPKKWRDKLYMHDMILDIQFRVGHFF